jgi:hypothetical protein
MERFFCIKLDGADPEVITLLLTDALTAELFAAAFPLDVTDDKDSELPPWTTGASFTS